ncbi:MAG: hypothetical protein V4690_00650 [Patescibacteria group bacterium]
MIEAPSRLLEKIQKDATIFVEVFRMWTIEYEGKFYGEFREDQSAIMFLINRGWRYRPRRFSQRRYLRGVGSRLKMVQVVWKAGFFIAEDRELLP